jgi:diguanylate cyclase (GGDEF)-like protein
MLRELLTSHSGRRIGVALALCAVVPLLSFAALTAREAVVAESRAAEARLADESRIFASALAGRIASAATLVEALASRDVGDRGELVGVQVAASPLFTSFALVDRDGLLASGINTLRPSPVQLDALERGDTILLAVVVPARTPVVFLARRVRAAGIERVGYFELAAQWLWSELPGNPDGASIAVVDLEGRVLNGERPASELGHMLSRRIHANFAAKSVRGAFSWHEAGGEWHGVLAPVVLPGERLVSLPWGVFAYEAERSMLEGAAAVWYALPVALLLAMAGVVFALKRLLPLHVPAIRAVRDALRGLPERRFERVEAESGDEARSLVDEFNLAAMSLEEQFNALETLGEVDRLLLGTAELEQVLDAMLTRVQTVTRCHCVGITLCDADAPQRARVFLAAAGLADLPVTRVALDGDMLATLASEHAGLTIARCEDVRHSFLKPLKDLGSEFFWVWPVSTGTRVEAILAVGYAEAPAADPQVPRYGAQFAGRLAVALTKNARDEQLYRQAHYDPLTALPNRLLFRDRLAQELANATAGLARGALLYIDLDHFKRVNDSVGHAAGDQLLQVTAQRLRACVKETDTVARMGGDEFTVILRNIADPDAARSVAMRVTQALQMPVNVADRDHYVRASIGITLFPEDGASIDELMRNADTAMYRAKDLGRGRLVFFDRSMAARQPAVLESGLHRALRRREFSLFYQPQYAVDDGSLVGVEALLRWHTPRGLRQPAEFVPAAEESGLIVDIGGWVLETACAQLASWREQGIAPPRLALNVSRQQLLHPEFARSLRRALDRYGLPAELLELELTEAIFGDATVGAALAALAEIGVGMVLDDFGSAYSSLDYLREHPIAGVKIDRTHLEDVPQASSAVTLVETIIVMAHALGKRVVAEGVETVEQLDFLREKRCDHAQGFYLARPLAVSAMTELLQARRPSADADVRVAG